MKALNMLSFISQIIMVYAAWEHNLILLAVCITFIVGTVIGAIFGSK